APNPVTQKGDTLSFDVAAFQGKQDRMIADVLRNIPGLEVDLSGRITYQGQPIQKYYIDGLDLLEGRYNLANNNLAADVVSEVQILENHQPIQVLDSLVPSDRASINIKLANPVTLTGEARVGAGWAPFLWDVNLTPIVFSPNQQALFSYQTNNTGDDVRQQVAPLTLDALREQRYIGNSGSYWLRMPEVKPSDLPAQRWLNNQVHLGSANILRRIGKHWEVKANLTYLQDEQYQEGDGETLFLTGQDSVRLFESKSNTLGYKAVRGGVILEKNIPKQYLRNEFTADWEEYGRTGQILGSLANLDQNVGQFRRFARNSFKGILPIGNQLITFQSILQAQHNQERLVVNPGPFPEVIIGSAEAFDQAGQTLSWQQLYTHNYLSFTRKANRWVFQSRLGGLFQQQQLQTQLTGKRSETWYPSITNALSFRRLMGYAEVETFYNHGNWRYKLETALRGHDFLIDWQSQEPRERVTRLTFEPTLSVNGELGPRWTIKASGGLTNGFGDLDRLYRNHLMVDYRSLQRNLAPLQQSWRQVYRVSVDYKKLEKSFFWRLDYSQSREVNNLLLQSVVSENGALSREALAIDNVRGYRLARASISKFVPQLKATFSLAANGTQSESEAILNNTPVDLLFRTLNLQPKVTTDITDKISVRLESGVSVFDNQQNGIRTSPIWVQKHAVGLHFFPTDFQVLSLQGDWFQTSANLASAPPPFLDLSYRYRFPNRPWEIELLGTNLWNTQSYITASNSAFQQVFQTYQLRPRQVLVKVRFNISADSLRRSTKE
ncbi:MAG: hypothetical protein AAFQ98_21505, partial [Bacteroidota bacterium]